MKERTQLCREKNLNISTTSEPKAVLTADIAATTLDPVTSITRRY